MDPETLEQFIAQVNNSLPELKKNPFSNLSKEQQEMLLLLLELKRIPVLNPPNAVSRHKYALAGIKKPAWRFFIRRFRFSLAATCVLLIISGLTYSVVTSLPGQRLFVLKKNAEQLRVKFALSDTQKAYLQLQIAKRRIAEAQKITNQMAPDNSGLKLAALKEVSHATEIAAQQMETLSPKTIQTAPQPLLASLQDVGQKEKELVSELSKNQEIQNGKEEDVIALSLKSQNKLSVIRQAVEVAVAEEALTSLSAAAPDSVVISGTITELAKNQLTVEKTVFLTGEQTVIADAGGKELTLENLKKGIIVAVSGKKDNNTLTALKITLLKETSKTDTSTITANSSATTDSPTRPQVTGNQSNLSNSTTPDSLLEPKNESETAEPEDEKPSNPNAASGNFIIESPLPQYAP